MENSSLNLAHFHSRKADNHIRYRRFDEAIASHQKAAELLEDAIGKSTVPKAIESLQLQRDFHIKYKELVRMKKVQFEKYRKAIEQQKQKSADAMEKMAKDRIENSCQLQLAIYKTMEDADSLLEVLTRKGSDTDSVSTNADDDTKTIKNDNINTIKLGIKKPKDDAIVIEELRTLNHQLHILVFQLVSQLDEINQESDTLREKVKFLERGKCVQNVVTMRPFEMHETNKPLSVFTDSAEGVVSTSNISSSDELSPKTAEARDLPPLELPEFDFSTFDNKK